MCLTAFVSLSDLNIVSLTDITKRKERAIIQKNFLKLALVLFIADCHKIGFLIYFAIVTKIYTFGRKWRKEKKVQKKSIKVQNI